MLFRKAKMPDVDKMAELISYYADKGMMLHRPIPTICQRIRDYVVVERDGLIVGVGGLHILWHDLAEICSLAIHHDYVKDGLGIKIVELLINEGIQLEVDKIFTLTYQPAFFEKCGFNRIDKEKLPQKVWMECINCPKFPNCDEIALIKKIG